MSDWNNAIEAAARVADQRKPGFCGTDRDVFDYELAESIAEAIRGLKHPEQEVEPKAQ